MKAFTLLMVVISAALMVESKTAPPPADCTTVVLSMSDCLSYVTNGSTTEKPEGNCCSGLKSVLKTNAGCLCEAFKSSSQFGIVLNNTKALALPAACGVHASPAAKCGCMFFLLLILIFFNECWRSSLFDMRLFIAVSISPAAAPSPGIYVPYFNSMRCSSLFVCF